MTSAEGVGHVVLQLLHQSETQYPATLQSYYKWIEW